MQTALVLVLAIHLSGCVALQRALQTNSTAGVQEASLTPAQQPIIIPGYIEHPQAQQLMQNDLACMNRCQSAGSQYAFCQRQCSY